MSLKNEHVELGAFGPVLATRRAARAVVARLEDLCREPVALDLSFADVEAVTSPFLDEILKAVQSEMARHESSLVSASEMNEDAYETLKMVLDRDHRALTYRQEDHYELVTSTPHLAETYEAAKGLGTFTTPDLAGALDLTVTAANQRLKALSEAGAVGRRPDSQAERGRRYLYFVMPTAIAAGDR
jgi:hypothetical protein